MEGKFEQVVSSLISPNNEVREQAEKEFEMMCREYTKDTLTSLINIMTQKPSMVELASLLIQKKIITVKDNATKLGNDEITRLIEICLALIESPQSTLNTLRRVSEIIVHLYRTVGKILLIKAMNPKIRSSLT